MNSAFSPTGTFLSGDDTRVRIIFGRVLDVAVDIRPQSLTFGKYVSVELDADSKKMFWIPKGFAHGFLALSDQAISTYKCTDIYDPSSEGGISGDDKTLAISWPKFDIPYKTSQRDGQHLGFIDQDVCVSQMAVSRTAGEALLVSLELC